MDAVQEQEGYCQFCLDLATDHPAGMCLVRPGSFVFGGYYKIIAASGQEYICDTLYQAGLIASNHHGTILDRHGKSVTTR